MKEKVAPIGIILDGLEDLFISQTYPQSYYFVEKNSFEHNWIQKFINKDKIFTFIYDDKIKSEDKGNIDDIIKHSNVPQILKDKNIQYIGFPGIISKFLMNWSKDNNIQTIVTPYFFQSRLEDKIWFDKFLVKHDIPKPKGIIYNHGKIDKKFKIIQKMVLQKRASWSGYGTYILENDTDIIKLLEKKVIQENKDYLLREFIEGKSYGITVFISPNKIALSALRLQCFYNNALYKNLYAGVQWVKTKKFSKEAQIKIYNIFSNLGKILYDMKFAGYANFDFIIDNNNDVFLIECNPRISGSTGQIVKFPKLISGINSGKDFIDNVVNPQKFTNFPQPQWDTTIDFEGSNLEINQFPESMQKPITVKNMYENGIYNYENKKIEYLTPDVGKLSTNNQELVFVSRITNPEITSTNNIETANIFSNFPLFNSDGKLNRDGERMFEIFNYKDNE